MEREAYTMLTLHIRGKDEGRGAIPSRRRSIRSRGCLAGGCFGRIWRPCALWRISRSSTAWILFYALVDGPIRRAYDTASGYAEAQTGGRLRLRLWIEHEAAELHALAWERMHFMAQGNPTPLATTAARVFSRYIGLEKAAPSPICDYPTRMLFVIANPDDLDAYHLAPSMWLKRSPASTRRLARCRRPARSS